ncbi:MAG: heme exporter protein CcmD [Gammaproteobacteria bacterium]
MSEFFAQGGYAFYVWGAYLPTLVLVLWEVIALRRQRRTLLARLGRIMRLRAQESRDEQE